MQKKSFNLLMNYFFIIGPIYREQLGPVEGVFIADDSLIKEVFSQEDANPKHLIPEPWLIYNEIKKVQRGLFFL